MNKVFAFLGTDHKCGTSQICQCAAEITALENPLYKVLLVHAHSSGGMDYAPSASESMERIRPYLADRLLDMEEITEKALWRDNLSVISGAGRPGSDGLYHPDMASFLLENLSDFYDVIICDCGADIENGLALGTLLSAGCIYAVATQNEASVRRWEWQLPLWEKLGLPEAPFIVNGYERGSIYTEDILRKRLALGDKDLFTVRKNRCGSVAETDGKSLLSYRDGRFKRDVSKISEDVIRRQTRWINTALPTI